MSISQMNLLITHLCAEEQEAPLNLWREGMSSDAMQYIFGSLSSFQDVVNCSYVCKNWCRNIRIVNVGRNLLNSAQLTVPRDVNWMKVYSIWLNTNYFIALDMSSSMSTYAEPWRLEVAKERINELAMRLEPVIQHKGINVIAFGTQSVHSTADSIQEVVSFFRGGHRIGGGTDFTGLTSEIYEAHQTLSRETLLPSEAIILSDMELGRNDQEFLFDIPRNLNLHLIQVGNSNTGDNVMAEIQSQVEKAKEPSKKRRRKVEPSILKNAEITFEKISPEVGVEDSDDLTDTLPLDF